MSRGLSYSGKGHRTTVVWPCSVVGLSILQGRATELQWCGPVPVVGTTHTHTAGPRTTVVWWQCRVEGMSIPSREGTTELYSGVALVPRVEACPYSGKGQELQWCGAV